MTDAIAGAVAAINESLKNWHPSDFTTTKTTALRTILDALAESQKDAARYRKLRASRSERTPTGLMVDCYDDGGALLYLDELDAAVDTMLAATPDAKEQTK